MALVLKNIFLQSSWIFRDLVDPRSQNYFILPPLDTLLFCSIYLHFVYISGPKLMQHRKPFELKNVLKAYNVSQILFNAVLFFLGMRELLKFKSWSCLSVDYSLNPQAVFQSRLCYWFYLLKLYDCLDTVFFILRKSTRQISFLHTYHHAGMCLASYIALAYLPGGETLWTGTINVFVHTFMFTYYLLSVTNKDLRNNIFFKKLLTQLQILQFILNIIIFGRLVFHPNCSYSKIAAYMYVAQNIFMFCLFSEFYRKTYVKGKRKSVEKGNQ